MPSVRARVRGALAGVAVAGLAAALAGGFLVPVDLVPVARVDLAAVVVLVVVVMSCSSWWWFLWRFQQNRGNACCTRAFAKNLGCDALDRHRARTAPSAPVAAGRGNHTRVRVPSRPRGHSVR